MKKIALTQGQFAIVDDEDFEELNQVKWCASRDGNTFYALRKGPRNKGQRKSIKMHRYILGLTDPKIFVDHINGNGLDNRRQNLRLCNNQQNQKNQRNRKNQKNRVDFKGVYFDEDIQKYSVSITIEAEKINLGFFSNPIEAAKTYNEAALKLFGQYAQLNEL
ncbi:MAG: hypothetical protein EBR82_70720 [Caulobacteraceae bacterium]|nr:hypothetical protein [Caulobacteraceae bacterium]